MSFLRLNAATNTAKPTPTVVNTQNIVYMNSHTDNYTDIYTQDRRQIRVHANLRDVLNQLNDQAVLPDFILLHRTQSTRPELVVNVSAIQSIEQSEGWNRIYVMLDGKKQEFGVHETQDEILELVETPTPSTPVPTGLVRDFRHS